MNKILVVFVVLHTFTVITAVNTSETNQTTVEATQTENSSLCSTQPPGRQFCPLPAEKEAPANCIPFPDYPSEPPPDEVLYTTSINPKPVGQCRSCDLKITSSGNAVILHCIQCFDTSSLKKM